MTATVLGYGARSPLGLNALQTAMALRARKLEPRSTSLADGQGRAVGLCRVGGLPDELVGYDRILRLGLPALREAWWCCSSRPTERVPMVLAIPEAGRPDDDERLVTSLVSDLARGADLPVDPALSRLVRQGHAGGATAFAEAFALLQEGHPAVVVGGIDSYVHPEVLRWLDAGYRLHALGRENGFIPAEGAAFLVLARRGRGFGRVASVQTGHEATVVDDAPNLAACMTALVERLGPTPWVLTDLNGERHRLREWTMVQLRLLGDALVQRPVAERGDVGAASGALFSALAMAYWRRSCAPADRALVALHAEGPERGAFLLEAAS